MEPLRLPALPRDAAWSDAPPDPLEQPALYHGVMLRRVFGFLIDVVIIAFTYLVAWLVVAFFTAVTLGLLTPLGVIALALLPIAYHSYFLGRYGATPGMQACDVEARTWNGQRLDYFQAFLMTALFYVTVPPTSGLVLVVCFFNARRRTLHDLLSGVLVVRRSPARAEAPSAA